MSNIKINELNNNPKKTSKTDRKNKTKQTVNWIKGHFTFSELHQKNQDIVEITLRTKINKAVETNAVVAIGTIPNRKQKGRPEVVYSMCPATPEILDSARIKGVIFNEKFSTSAIEVMNVNINDVKSKESTVTIPLDKMKHVTT